MNSVEHSGRNEFPDNSEGEHRKRMWRPSLTTLPNQDKSQTPFRRFLFNSAAVSSFCERTRPSDQTSGAACVAARDPDCPQDDGGYNHGREAVDVVFRVFRSAEAFPERIGLNNCGCLRGFCLDLQF